MCFSLFVPATFCEPKKANFCVLFLPWNQNSIAILWMSPIYAVTSWFSLVFHAAEGYLAILKDGYEAYIIYQVSCDLNTITYLVKEISF